MKKKIFLIGLCALFSLAAAEKRTAGKAELPDSKLPPKKRSNREGTVIIDQQKPPTDSAITLPLHLPLAAAQAPQYVANQELPPPDAHYHCLKCKGNFEVSKEEHEQACMVLKATIVCTNRSCRRKFIRYCDLTLHLNYCQYKK